MIILMFRASCDYCEIIHLLFVDRCPFKSQDGLCFYWLYSSLVTEMINFVTQSEEAMFVLPRFQKWYTGFGVVSF